MPFKLPLYSEQLDNLVENGFFQLVIGESQDHKTLFSKMSVPLFIVFSLTLLIVNRTIQFNNQSLFKTTKVGNITINRLLAPEFEPMKSTIPQESPETLLVRRHSFSKIASPFC